MTTFKKYLGYRLKSSLLQTVTFALIALVITVTTANEGVRYLEYGTKARTGIESLATIMCIVASIIPMLETDCFKNRRNLDTLYFLPLSRFKLAMAHYLSGIIQVFVIYTVAFLGHVIALLKYALYFRLQYMPLYYVLLLLLGIAIYSVFIFLFGEANSTTDGFICSVMWIFALYLVALVVIIPIREYAYYYVYGDNIKCFEFTRNLNNFTTWFIPYTPVNNLTVVFQHVMEGVTEFTGEIKNESGELATLHLWPTFADVIEEKYSQWYMFFLPVIAGAASVYGYFRTFARKGAEKAGDISDSPFCYKVLIPIYGVVCFIFTGFNGIMSFLTAAGMYFAYAIYRKSFKIRKTDIFAMLGTAAASLVFLIADSLIFR